MIDTHAHLTDAKYFGEVDDVVERAKDCGVDFVITSGFDIVSSQKAVELAEKYSNVYATIGVYPENCQEFDENAEKTLKNMAKNPKVVGIGEIGLQYTENSPEKELQKYVFEKQIDLAFENALPIVIHCRDAYGDMLEILKKNKNKLVYGGTLHCYSGSKEMAKEFVKLGLNISVGGVSTFKNAQGIKEALKSVPIEKIVLETDCPYLAPHPYRGQKNQPAYLPTIAQNLALLKEMTVEEVIKATDENARRMFKI